MALFAGDQRELVLPLQNGIGEDRPFATFLSRLRARTGADRALLFAGQPGGTPGIAGQATARGASPLESGALDAALDLPIASLRPERVYALAELPLANDPASAGRRAAMGLGYGRLLRVAPREDLNAWLLLFHAAVDFTAADSALLSGLAPHLAAAVELRARFDTLALRARIAEDALARLGIAQAAFDAGGRALAGDPAARLPRGAALGNLTGTRLVGEGEEALLARPLPGDEPALPAPARAVVATRHPRRDNRREAAALLAELHGLSLREAALADALSRGLPLVEAGVALGLTPETTRNYSKRIYAKTGTTGQADLVRLVLDGLAVLA